ncbi:unnamed protein product [Prunus armeniaca]
MMSGRETALALALAKLAQARPFYKMKKIDGEQHRRHQKSDMNMTSWWSSARQISCYQNAELSMESVLHPHQLLAFGCANANILHR